MSQKIQIRRGTDAQRLLTALDEGEFGYTTDLNELWCGDAVTLGGVFIGGPGMVKDFGDISISATGNSTISTMQRFLHLNARVIAAAGSGAYTRKIILSSGIALTGAIVMLNIELAASVNPTVEIRDLTSGGTLLQTFTGIATAATYPFCIFKFDGTNWHKLFAAFNQ